MSNLTTSASLLDAIRAHRLLSDEQVNAVTGLVPRIPNPRDLARELINRGWLTAFQVNQLFRGEGKDLVLGSYVLVERLGEGAMGLVYKARHITMGRMVALKVIRRERLAHPKAIRRFEREVRAVAQLAHPNVVIAYDASHANGVHYMAMEYVEGKDLGRLVKLKGPLSVAHALNYMRQTAAFLQYLHERAMVHRDIKPTNLLLTKDGSTIKVLDLGLARINEVGEGETSHITQEGFIVGTPDYMAPEQALNSHAADIRSDLYSLGCTFYYVLAGSVPYPVKGLQQKLVHHQTSPAPAIEKKRPEVPVSVAVVIRRLMAKRPEDRYQIPAELAYDLGHIITTGGLPDRTRPAMGILVK
jgi:serine/threonine protein kinase